MIVDAAGVVVAATPALRAFLGEAEPALQRDLPEFRAASLIGANVSLFLRHDAQARAAVASLSTPLNLTITLGGRAFDWAVSPLQPASRHSFLLVEWADGDASRRSLDCIAQVSAIGRNQAVIEFTPDGRIVDANELFTKVMGYSVDELRGRHHEMFVTPEYRQSQEYRDFWAKLRRGELRAGQFKRVTKAGQEVWIHGAYNPIPGPNGDVVKVVKFASDVSNQVRFVQSVGSGLASLARGNLTQRLDVALSPELDQVRTDFNTALSVLEETMRETAQSALAVKERSEALRASSDDLSLRSESQAAALEESAAALNEVTATVQRTSGGAAQARTLVSTAQAGAGSAAEVMRETVSAMSALEASSSQIAQIIGTIDEIAFQTNLLALNAGVEAARAGDAGRGFAVVASEVRGLAQRSAEAAKEIKSLIAASARHVGQGVQLVEKTGKALDQIIGNVNDINGVVGEIAASAQEQAASLQQVNDTIGQMSGSTQQNAAMAQETRAATRALGEEAARVVELLGKFSFESAAAPKRSSLAVSRPRPAPPPPAPAASAPRPPRRMLAQAATAEDWTEF